MVDSSYVNYDWINMNEKIIGWNTIFSILTRVNIRYIMVYYMYIFYWRIEKKMLILSFLQKCVAALNNTSYIEKAPFRDKMSQPNVTITRTPKPQLRATPIEISTGINVQYKIETCNIYTILYRLMYSTSYTVFKTVIIMLIICRF